MPVPALRSQCTRWHVRELSTTELRRPYRGPAVPEAAHSHNYVAHVTREKGNSPTRSGRLRQRDQSAKDL